MLPPDARLGNVDTATLPPPTEDTTISEVQRLRAREVMPPAHGMIQLQDFDYWAQKILSQVAWAYYRSAADTERSTEAIFCF